MAKRRIALDLDGCFADFFGYIEKYFGVPYNKNLWPAIDIIPHIFYKLDLIPESKELFDLAWSYRDTHEVFVLTAIPYPTHELIHAAEDKKRWVARHLSPDIPVHTVIGGDNKKYWVNDFDDILVDDAARNINSWISMGGLGVHHNGDFQQTLERFEKAINKSRECKKLVYNFPTMC